MTEKIIKILKRFFTGNGIVILILLGLISLRVYDPWPVQVLRLKSWDFLQTTLPKVHSNDVVIVEIDEKSVPKYGQWPWDRKDIADIIDKLRAGGAGIIVIPAVFSEPDRAKGDDVLAKKIKENGVVIAQTVTTQTKKPDAQRRGVAKVGEDPAPFLYAWPGALKPINILANNADGVGVIASAPEPDGVVRRMPMLVRIQDNIYPSLTMEALRVSTGDPSYQVKASEAGIEAVRVPQYGAVTTDPTGSVWMNWNYEFDRISVTDDFKKRVKDKVVILGVSLEGVGGVIATPTGSAWSHDMQASMIQTIVDKNNIQRYAWSTFIELLCIVAIGIAIIYFVPRASVLLTVPIIVVFIGLYSYSSYYLFTELHQLCEYSRPVVTCLLYTSDAADD
jgi:adenylate cyclase